MVEEALWLGTRKYGISLAVRWCVDLPTRDAAGSFNRKLWGQNPVGEEAPLDSAPEPVQSAESIQQMEQAGKSLSFHESWQS